jgi:hypothetical protein
VRFQTRPGAATGQDVFGLLLETNKTLQDSLVQFKAQNAELRRMLFGQRSEKMPSMASEARRAIDADELVGPAPDESSAGSDTSPSVPDPDEEETKRRKRSVSAVKRNVKLPVRRATASSP